MDNSLRFDDLPLGLRRLAASIHLAIAFACLWPWTKLPALLARPTVSWAGIAFGVVVSLGGAYLMGKQGLALLRPRSDPTLDAAASKPRHGARTYYLAAICFGCLAVSVPLLERSWYAALFFLLVAAGSLGEAYRATQAGRVLSDPSQSSSRTDGA
jgi:hypothetical protein